ncbi:MAG: hypothetical protein O9972_02480 [Burkholderiales bacterium]|nr:hypothetical protein [Burkholderiales bacterium]
MRPAGSQVGAVDPVGAERPLAVGGTVDTVPPAPGHLDGGES